jgi:hypothetical protein
MPALTSAVISAVISALMSALQLVICPYDSGANCQPFTPRVLAWQIHDAPATMRTLQHASSTQAPPREASAGSCALPLRPRRAAKHRGYRFMQ